ncbi:HK97 family phage prohead protease [Sinorhizobium meliloti]|nr:HK97 family phage prohead protease [Sinorhizobium meliloti]MDW9512864.1 HK97 family phage prohead protease [Sinorhizobium meliloti]
MKTVLHVKNSSAVRLTPALHVKLAPSDTGEIFGYASAFDGPPDSYGDIIAKGAFRRTLADHQREGTTPAMLWSHDMKAPIGRWTELSEDDYGLHVRGQINMETSRGRDAFAHLKSGDVGGFSIGFFPAPGGTTKLNNGTQLLTEIELVEVSVVAVPANRRARVQGVKTLSSKSELIDLLREGGLPKAAATRIAAAGWTGLVGEDQQKAIDFAAEITRATEKLKVKS